MKVLFIARPNLYKVKGGDTTQVDNTAKELIKLGIHVDINLSYKNIDYNSYDVLHFFNIVDCEDLLGHTFKSNKPFVISTIYVDYREYDRNYRKDLIGFLSRFFSYDQIEYFKTLAKFLLKGEMISTYRFFIKGHGGSVKFLLRKSACLLPNSHSEYKRISKDYQIEKKYFFIPNGIDPRIFYLDNENKRRNIVLCVARIEGIKNQLNLIRAMNNSVIKLVLIGSVAPNQKKYFEQCRSEAAANIEFIDAISQEKLVEYYSIAKVHVLPSWFETTGLASLEAGVMGCNLVVSNRGDVRDYFHDYVNYCEPGDINSIREAVLKAWRTPQSNILRNYVLENFTWKKTAENTLHAYKYAVSTIVV